MLCDDLKGWMRREREVQEGGNMYITMTGLVVVYSRNLYNTVKQLSSS